MRVAGWLKKWDARRRQEWIFPWCGMRIDACKRMLVLDPLSRFTFAVKTEFSATNCRGEEAQC